ncbi:hypothetical protein HMPREF2943_07555 [Corynebacterium sp. HMSC072D12]|nr:hypothetical protein HMPREF2943_07555 [Corynebacterium sp. HMSC072D12]
MEKKLEVLQSEVGNLEGQLEGVRSHLDDKLTEVLRVPTESSRPNKRFRPTAAEPISQHDGFHYVASIASAVNRLFARLYNVITKQSENKNSPKEQSDSLLVTQANAEEQNRTVVVKSAMSAPVSLPKPEKKMAELLSGAFSTAGESVAEQTKDRMIDPRKPRVLFVSSNGAGLGHLTRLSAVDKNLDSLSLFYTMSSAYKMIGKSSTEAIYFPSHGDLGMVGKLWNPLMEEHFDSVVEGFQPDAIVFDGTYVYRGVISVSKKRRVPLIWMQRGCWKPEVDAKSKQRHRADKFAAMVMVPGDYGCEESVDVGQGMEAVYLPPVTLATRGDLLSREEARAMLGLPKDKKLFLVQLGAGNINDISDIRETALDAVRSLGADWAPVLVRNPLSKNAQESDALSIQAYPLSIYYNAFEAGAFAAGYNTVQESIEMGLPSVFVPNLQTKTDDQGRRASEVQSRGLGLSATDTSELSKTIRMLGKSAVREEIRGRQDLVRAASGGMHAAQAITSFLNREGISKGQ